MTLLSDARDTLQVVFHTYSTPLEGSPRCLDTIANGDTSHHPNEHISTDEHISTTLTHQPNNQPTNQRERSQKFMPPHINGWWITPIGALTVLQPVGTGPPCPWTTCALRSNPQPKPAPKPTPTPAPKSKPRSNHTSKPKSPPTQVAALRQVMADILLYPRYSRL